MTRRLLTLASALSLLLCVAVCVLWVRSYWHLDQLSLHVARSATSPVDSYEITLASGCGGLAVGYDAPRGPYTAADGRRLLPGGWRVVRRRWDPEYAGSDDADAAKREWRALGVRLYRYRDKRPGGDHSVWVTVPSWLVAALASVPPGAWAVRRRWPVAAARATSARRAATTSAPRRGAARSAARRPPLPPANEAPPA